MAAMVVICAQKKGWLNGNCSALFAWTQSDDRIRLRRGKVV